MLTSSACQVWDTGWLLPQSSVVGIILHTLIGYNDQPTAMQLIAYVATIVRRWSC